MSIMVRPISANLTHDTEFLARMVIFGLSRTPTPKFISVGSSIELKYVLMEEKILLGTLYLILMLGQTLILEWKFGIQMLATMT
jgi:hypothetical protein